MRWSIKFDWTFRTQPHPARRLVFGQLVPHIRDVLMLQVKEGENWRQIGYCGAQPGRPISLLERYPQEFQDSVREFVEREIGAPSCLVTARTTNTQEEGSE
jgi:hypothetical protein